MTEEQEEEELTPLFVVGAQVTADGDMLPESFTVFSVDTSPGDAAETVMQKIMSEVRKMEMGAANGVMVFEYIITWEQFAAINVDREVKMAALASAIGLRFLDLLRFGATTSKIITLPWVPSQWEAKDN